MNGNTGAKMIADIWLFHAINSLGTPLLDPVMAAFSSPPLAIPLVLLAFALETRERGWRASLRTVAIVTAAVILSNSASQLLKVLLGRVRPCGELVLVRLVGDCPSSLSMPSGHATNSYAVAMTWGGSLPRPARWAGYIVATLICISRVYLGVHYPSDVVVGAGLGTIVGLAFRVWARRNV